ncbi:AAEL013204-PA [Aedes aegypti]|uniref:AAEL013204-PA n=1 Tax=Aedes aegypti TaxID=7159 RepID=Q16JU9_AEDAE|nr:AAEL013204-PA [Aedes aegypti]
MSQSQTKKRRNRKRCKMEPAVAFPQIKEEGTKPDVAMDMAIPSSSLTPQAEGGECSSCKDTVANPVTCSSCDKFFCSKCFEVWLSLTPRTMCPGCVAEMKKRDDCCGDHDQVLNLFCLTCGTRICSGCFLNTAGHKRHQIDDLDVVYREKLAETNGKLNEVGDVLLQFQSVVDTTEQNAGMICKTEDDMQTEMGQLMEKAKAEAAGWKEGKLRLCQLRKEVPIKRKLLFEELQGRINGLAKHEFIARKDELELEAAALIPNAQALYPPPIDYHDYECSLIPQCRMVPIILDNFSRHFDDPKYDVIASMDISDSSETFWTIRVFKGTHLTVDFSQKQLLKHSLSFQLYVEIFHIDHRNTLCTMQETQSTNCHIDLIEMNQLKERGFLSKADEISLGIWIRPTSIIVERQALTLNFLDLKRQKFELDDKYNGVVSKLAESEQFSVGYFRIPLDKLQFPEDGTSDTLQIKSHAIKDFSGRSWCMYVERVKANRICAESYIGVYLMLCSPLKKKTSTLRRRFYLELVNKDRDYSIRKYSADKFGSTARFGWSPFVRMSRVFADSSGFVHKGAIGFRFGVQNMKRK